MLQPRLPVNKEINLVLSPLEITSFTCIPNGNTHLTFISGHGKLKYERATVSGFLEEGLYISGPQFEIADHDAGSSFLKISALEMEPFAIAQIFGIPPQYLKNSIVKLEDIVGNKCKALLETLINSNDAIDQTALIKSFLFKSAASKKVDPKLESVKKIVSMLNHREGIGKLKDISKYLNISQRSLERNFKNSIGVSPKAYCKIRQFKSAFEKILDCKMKLSSMNNDNGYYDQSHFLSHFKKVIGKYPEDYFESKQFSPSKFEGYCDEKISSLKKILPGIYFM